jgi:hypothetical protein
MRNIGLPQTKGYIDRFTDQSKKLLTCGISIEKNTINSEVGSRMFITDSTEFLWTPLKDDNTGTKNLRGKIEISEKFAKLVWNESVPVDMRIYRALFRSPLAMDIYAWLVYRFHALDKKNQQSVKIPLEGLMSQFGIGYPSNPQGLYDFKRNFLQQLEVVLHFYPEAKNHATCGHRNEYLILTKCPLHIRKR